MMVYVPKAYSCTPWCQIVSSGTQNNAEASARIHVSEQLFSDDHLWISMEGLLFKSTKLFLNMEIESWQEWMQTLIPIYIQTITWSQIEYSVIEGNTVGNRIRVLLKIECLRYIDFEHQVSCTIHQRKRFDFRIQTTNR